jgi:hypothetical protein
MESRDTLIVENPVALRTLTFPKALRVPVLAPHPDGFDVIGVAMRFLRESGNPLYLAVATSGASGVEDTFLMGRMSTWVTSGCMPCFVGLREKQPIHWWPF